MSLSPNSSNCNPEHQQYILALTGPSGVGKTTISKMLGHVFGEYVVRVPMYTTRAPKPGDDGEYMYVTLDEFHRMCEEKQIVAFTNIPSSSEERWHGYDGQDIERIWQMGKIPVVITEMNLLQNLAAYYGRRSILSFGLLPPGKSKRTMLSHLLYRLRHRGRETEEQMKDRLQNADGDLRFFEERKDLFNVLLVNESLPIVQESFAEYFATLPKSPKPTRMMR